MKNRPSTSRNPLLLAAWLALCVVAWAQPPAPQSAKERTILQIQQMMERNDGEGARSAVTGALKRYPGDAGLENLRGILEAQRGDFRAAEQAFTRAVTRSPRFTNAYLNLGRLYQEQAAGSEQALSKALRVYQRLLRHSPDNTEANYQCAVLQQQLGNAQASLLHLQRLPAEHQGGANVLALLSGAYAANGDRARTSDAIERLASHPDLSEPDTIAALPALVKFQREDLALRLLEALDRRGSAGPETQRRLGLLYEQQNRLDRARLTLEKAGPPTVPLLLDLARVAFQQRDYQGALGYLAHGRDLEPQRAQIHYLFGQTCIRLELVAEAHLAFVKAVELERDNPEYNYAAGAAAAYLRDPSEAVPFFLKYLKLRPNDAQGRLMLGAVYVKNREFDLARAELRAASADQRAAPGAHYYLGRIARQQGALPEAARELQRALELEPRYAAALAELGQCRLQQREYPAAEQALQQALAIDADNYAANFTLLTLYSRTRDPRESAQAARFEQIKQRRSEKEQEFLRAIETRPR
ncbi:MAG: tetratricopeptide repeat protein [Blastocatellia bacterium]